MKKNKKYSSWITFILIGIPLIIAASYVGYSMVSCLIKWQTMKSWVEAPAIILNTHLRVKHKRTSKGGTSTSYKVTASYSYTYKDNSYTGSQVTMHTGSNSFPFHRKIYDELNRYKKSGEPFHCYVNPENPSEAILFRVPRWEVIYVYFGVTILFSGTGLVLLFLGLQNRKIKQQENQLKSLYPDEQWKWKIEWKNGQILSHSKLKAAHITGVAIIWNLISSFLIIFLYEIFNNMGYIALFFLIFPAVGIGIAIWAIRLILQWFKYGQSIFEIQSVPGVIGGALSGKIHTKVNIKPQDGFHLRLSCINRVTTRSGKIRKTSDNIKWQDSCNIAHEMYEYDPSHSVIPVLFQIPYDSPGTNSDNPNNKIFWRLEISAKVPGVDYAASFEVPVFKTPQSSKDFVLDKSSITSYQTSFDRAAALEAEGIRVEELSSGRKKYYFDGVCNKVFIMFFSLFFVFWTLITVLLFKQKAISILAFALALIDILWLLILLDSIFFRSIADVSPKGISITKRMLFIRHIQKLDFDSIEKFKIKIGSKHGNKVYYNLNVVIKSGKDCLITKDLTNRQIAEHLAQEMEKILLA